MTSFQEVISAAFEAAKKDQERVAFVVDGHHKGTSFLWRDDRWEIVDHEGNKLDYADEIAVVRLEHEADADEGLNQACVGCDLDAALWIVPAEALEELAGYGESLETLWRG